MDGPWIEFLPEAESTQPAPTPEPPHSRLTPPRAVIAAVALLAVASLIASHVDGGSARRPVAAPTFALPTLAPEPPCGTACDSDPSPAIRAVFADHLPGAVVVLEHTFPGHGSTQPVVARSLRAVYGNVVITVTISLAPRSARPSRGTGFVRGGYLIEFSFAGYYAPSTAEVHALADDPRLISPMA